MQSRFDGLGETAVPALNGPKPAASMTDELPLVSSADLVNPMMRAIDLAEKTVPRCRPDLPLAEAATMLAVAESGWLVVVENEKPVGVLSERNVVEAMAKSASQFAQLTAGQSMSRDVSRVRDHDRLDALLFTFGSRGTLVVDRSGRLVGAIYWRNLAGAFSERGLGQVLVKMLEREGAIGSSR